MSRGTGTGRHSGGKSGPQLTGIAAGKLAWNTQLEQLTSLRWNECCNSAMSMIKMLTTRATAGLVPWQVTGFTLPVLAGWDNMPTVHRRNLGYRPPGHVLGLFFCVPSIEIHHHYNPITS